MDKFTETMLSATGLLGMIGKAERGPEAIAAIKKHQAVYLMAVGGAAYLSCISCQNLALLFCTLCLSSSPKKQQMNSRSSRNSAPAPHSTAKASDRRDKSPPPRRQPSKHILSLNNPTGEAMEIEIDLPLYNSIVASVTDSLVQRQTKAVEQLSNLRSWLDSHEQLDALQQAKELHELEERHRLQIEAVKRMHSDSRQTNTVIYQTLTQSFEAQLRNYATELATWSGKVNPNLPTFQPLLIQSRASAPVAGSDEEFRYLPTGDQTERADGMLKRKVETG